MVLLLYPGPFSPIVAAHRLDHDPHSDTRESAVYGITALDILESCV